MTTSGYALELNDSSGDTFGITYKKHERNHDNRPIILIEDEIEFESSMSTTISNKNDMKRVNDDDDEFEFDIDPTTNVNDDLKIVLQRVAEKVASSAFIEFKEEEESDKEIEILNGSSAPSLSFSTSFAANFDNTTAIRAAAVVALSEMMEIYSSQSSSASFSEDSENNFETSIGTHPSLSLSSSSSSSSSSSLSSSSTPSKSLNSILKPTIALHAIDVIEEGDEEAAEEEEREELRIHDNKLQMMISEKTKLEEEWISVSSVTSSSSSNAIVKLTDGNISSINNSTSTNTGSTLSTPSLESSSSASFSNISYFDAEDYFRKKEWTAQEKEVIIVRDGLTKDGGMSGILKSFLKSASISTQLSFPASTEELEFPFLVAQCDYDPSHPTLLRMLQTIYVSLSLCGTTSSSSSSSSSSSTFTASSIPAATGPHWDNIGFQGLDPRTDLNRSMKMLAVLQALHLVHTELPFAQAVHGISGSHTAAATNTSNSATNEEEMVVSKGKGHGTISGRKMDLSWPFMCVSIMFTKESIQVLRAGILNKKCNKRQAVLSLLHDFHHALLAAFVTLLLADPLTHHAIHLQKIRDRVKSNPLSLLKEFPLSARQLLTAQILAKLNPTHINVSNSNGLSNSNSNNSESNSSNKEVAFFTDASSKSSVLTKTHTTMEGDISLSQKVNRDEAMQLEFSDLSNAVEIADECEREGREEGTGSMKSLWRNMTIGNSKASKFKA